MINTQNTKANSQKLQMYAPSILKINNHKNQQKLTNWLSDKMVEYQGYHDFNAQLSIDFHNNIFIHDTIYDMPTKNIVIKPKVISRNRHSIARWAEEILAVAEQNLQNRYDTEKDANPKELSDILYDHNLDYWSPMFSAKSYVDYIVDNLDNCHCNMINVPYLRKEPVYLAEQLLTNFHAEMFKNGTVLGIIISCFDDIDFYIDPAISILMNKIIVELTNSNSVINTVACGHINYQRIVELYNSDNTIILPMQAIFKINYESNVYFKLVNDSDYLTTLNSLNEECHEHRIKTSHLNKLVKHSCIAGYRSKFEQEIKAISNFKNQAFFKELSDSLQLILDNAK